MALFLVVNYGGTFEFDAAALSGNFSEANLHTGRVWALALLVNLNLNSTSASIWLLGRGSAASNFHRCARPLLFYMRCGALHAALDLVVLDCNRCDKRRGVRIVRRMYDHTTAVRASVAARKVDPSFGWHDHNSGGPLGTYLAPYLTFTGQRTRFTLVLDESAGWVKEPACAAASSSRSSAEVCEWLPPSQAEFVELLSGISRLRILGDFTVGAESVALDTVRFVARAGGAVDLTAYAQVWRQSYIFMWR